MSKKTKFGISEPGLTTEKKGTNSPWSKFIQFLLWWVSQGYRRVFYEIADKLKGEIEHRYSSPAFALYTDVELILRKAASGESIPSDILLKVFEHFGDDLQKDELTTELGMLKNAMVGVIYSINNIREDSKISGIVSTDLTAFPVAFSDASHISN